MKAAGFWRRSSFIEGDPPFPHPAQAEVGLVIPCFREGDRLPGFLPRLCENLDDPSLPETLLLVVDDGSGEPHVSVVHDLVESLRPRYRFLGPLLRLPANVGKGATIRTGWNRLADSCRLLAFVDADGAVPGPEVARFLRLAAAQPADTALFASRLDASKVARRPGRRLAGLMFRLLVRILFRLPVRDTQCGLKAVPTAAYQRLRDRLRQKGFLFDVELAAQLARTGVGIVAESVAWREIPGSHLRPGHVLAMLRTIISIRWNLSCRRAPD